MFTIDAPAKVNLFLNLQGLRGDGFHQVRFIMQTLALSDRLTLRPLTEAEREGSESPLIFQCDNPLLNEEVQSRQTDNIVVKAYHLFYQETQLSPLPLHVFLEKKIPFQAGLGGGSSDAAAMLKALARFAGGISKNTLEKIAGQLGSDVPFFLTGGTALAQGRGEEITPLPITLPPYPVLLIKPKNWGISTPVAYQKIREAGIYQCHEVQPLVDALVNDSEDFKAHSICDPPTWQNLMRNDFEPVLIESYPALKEIKGKMKALGIRSPLLCGSGPTYFGFLPQGLVSIDGSGTEKGCAKNADLLQLSHLHQKPGEEVLQEAFPSKDYEWYPTTFCPGES
ncbi:MAG: 4-(cytidine 5'-diphospho)-2-C-methyl-D-erythritol kinase [Cyanobacteria bacterium]|nr:4-(cytidine 5'-diphospho)-2-C-methyl-D-erythritol kinase [Cyanobacteriota bacterium]